MDTRSFPRRIDGLLPFLDRMVKPLGLRLTRSDYEIRHAPAWQRDVVAKVTPFTATDGPAIIGLLDAVDYIEANQILGEIVECGVFRGGSMMAAALGLLHHTSQPRREIWLYDTFSGMTEPSSKDIRSRDGLKARAVHDKEEKLPISHQSDWYWVRAELEAVRSNISQTAYPDGLLRYVEGRVEDTIPRETPRSIALLRLDTDWYESTRHELQHLVPLMTPGSVLIVDDYHYWEGSKHAVDEYFSTAGLSPLWTRISSSGAVITVLP